MTVVSHLLKMVSEIHLIVYISVCVAYCAAQDSLPAEKKFDDVQAAVFSQGVYPKTGDIPVLNRKIFGASRVSIAEHPYIVSVRRLHAHYLTGAILTMTTVLTVAHPIYNVPLNQLGVVAGENYCDRGAGYQSVLLVITHEDFDPSTLLADLAMLRLCESMFNKVDQKPIAISSGSEFKPISRFLNRPYKNPKLQKVFVTGWGRCDWIGNELCLPRSSVYFPGERLDPMLRTISFNHSELVENPYCVGYEKNRIHLARDRGMLCVGTAREESPLAPCLAVPGAALTFAAKLVGLQSWGFGCGYTHDLPLVYTDLRYYSDWLHFNLAILNHLTWIEVSDLYIATKAYIIQDWLVQTSDARPSPLELGPKIRVSAIDTFLIGLKGNVTDIRDYAYGGKYKMAKEKMHQELKNNLQQKRRLLDISATLHTKSARPFLNTHLSSSDDIDSTEDASVNDSEEE